MNIYSIQTDDRQIIQLNHYACENEHVIIIAHGFFNNKDTILFRSMSARLAEQYDVMCFDFRGHGNSSGWFTWTADETKDLKAVVRCAKEKGYRSVGVIGFSLGAAITIIEAAQNTDVDSVISVSSPYDIWKINFEFWRPEMISDLKLNLGPKGKGKSIRPGNPFRDKIPPIECVANISPRPILFVHGRQDWLIHCNHSKRLFERAKEPKELCILKDAGHAEKIFDAFPDSFIEIANTWFNKTLPV